MRLVLHRIWARLSWQGLRVLIARHLLDPAPARHALRTALAASITYILTQAFALEQGYWAVFSSILVMQAHIGSSLVASWSRLMGTAAGAALGAIVASLFGPGLWTTAASMFLAILVCSRLAANNDSLRLASLTAALVICLHEPGGSAFLIGMNRFLEVVVGIGVALAVSFAYPSRAGEVLRHGLAKGLEQLADLTAALMDSRMQGQYDRQRIFHRKDSLLRLSIRNRQLLGTARHEPGSANQRARLATLLQVQERIAEHLLTMDHAIENAPAEGFHLHLPQELRALGAAVQGGMLALAATLLPTQPASAAQHDASAPHNASAPPSNDLAKAMRQLNSALDATGQKLLDLRKLRIIAGYDLDEVMHFYSFYHALREIAREVSALAERAGELR